MLAMRVQDDKQTNVGGPSLGQHRKADKWFRNGCRVRDEKLRQLVLSMHHSGGTGAAKRCRSRTKGFVRVQRASSSPVDFSYSLTASEAGSRQSPVGKWRIAGQIVSTQDDLQREQAGAASFWYSLRVGFCATPGDGAADCQCAALHGDHVTGAGGKLIKPLWVSSA